MNFYKKRVQAFKSRTVTKMYWDPDPLKTKKHAIGKRKQLSGSHSPLLEKKKNFLAKFLTGECKVEINI
jgi:hypothetical protein